MHKFWNSGLIQSKILLSIFAVVVSIAGFEVWKWNHEQHEKFIAEQITKCQLAIERADRYINHSRILSAYVKNKKLDIAKVQQPGINSSFKKDKYYILFYKQPHGLIPDAPIYDDSFFRDLAKSSTELPLALMVQADSLSNGKVIVYSSCTPKPFEVSSNNLYEYLQSEDLHVTPLNGF